MPVLQPLDAVITNLKKVRCVDSFRSSRWRSMCCGLIFYIPFNKSIKVACDFLDEEKLGKFAVVGEFSGQNYFLNFFYILPSNTRLSKFRSRDICVAPLAIE